MAFSAGGGSASLGSAEGRIVINTEAAERSLKQLQGSVGTFATSTESAFGRIATGVGLLAVSKGVFNFFGGGVNSARDFEQAIANVNAVIDLTAEQLEQVSKAAQRLGADSVFSATEAANAMEELAKAGVSVEDILHGAADGAVALAASAGIGLPQAATIIATAMNTFGLAGDQATHVADVFSAAANKSAADADGLAQSLQQVGLVAATNNITLEETTGILALLADNGLKGSDAGTALKTAIQSLLTPMGRGADVMAQYGINVRDASGNFIGFAATADELHRALDPLPKDLRDQALAAIFGTDAIRVGNVLWREGGDAITDYTTAVNDSGAASETAAKRLNTFNGALEQLRGAVESASIIIGKAFLPALKSLVQALTVIVQAFIGLPSPVQKALAGLVGASGVIAGLAGVMVLAGPKMAAFGEALKTIRVALLGFAAANPIVLAVVAALALLGIAYKTNFGGFADAVNGAIDKVKEFGKVFSRSFDFSRSLPDIGNVGAAFAALGQAMTEILGIDVYKQFRTIGNIADRIGKSLNRMSRQFSVLSRAIKRGGLAEGFDQLFGKVGKNLLAEFGDLLGALPRTVGTALRQITTGFDPLDRALKNTGSAFQQFGRFVENVFAGDFDRALQNFQNVGKRLKAGAIDISGIVVRIASWAFETLVDLGGAVRSFVTDTLWPQVKSTAAEIPDAAVRVMSWAVDATGDLIAAVAAFVTDTAWPAVKDTATDIADAVVNIASWSVRAASGLWDAVSTVAVNAWNLVKNIAIGIPDALISVKNFVVSLGDSVWGAVGSKVLSAWNFVKDTAIDIKDVALNVVGWVTDQIESGTLVDSVRQFVEDTLATLNVTISDWKLTVGAPDDAGITIDVAGIWDKIWNDIINPTFTPEQTQAAEDAGSNIGAKAVELLVKGIKAAFGLGQKVSGGGGGGGEGQLTGKDIVGQFIKGFFEGAFGEALGVGSDLSEQARTWASNTLTAIRKAISDVFTGKSFLQTGPGGDFAGAQVVEQAGIFDSLLEALKLPDIPTPELPDWLTNTSWLTGPIGSLTRAINAAIGPLQKAWDTYKSIKDLFSRIGSNNGKPITPGDLDGDGKPDLTDPDPRDPQKFINLGGAIGNLGSTLTTFAANVSSAGPTITQGMRDILAALGGGGDSGAVSGAGSALANFGKNLPELKLPAPDLSALTDGLGNAVNVTRDAMGEIVDVAAGVIGPLASAGQNAAQGFAAGITNGMRVAIGAAATGAAQVVNAARANLASLGPAGFGVGQSLGFGIASGISSTVGSVVSAAVNLVFAAVNAAKFAAQIASPSKLMAKEIGVPLAQGVALGIDNGSGTVQHSLASLIGGLVPTSTSTSRMLGSQPVGAAASGARGASVVNVFALHPDDWVQYANMARRGSEAGDFVDDLPRSYGLVFGGGV